MTQKIINIGTSPNKGDGDPLRTAFSKINDNFTELYATDIDTKYHLGDDVQFVNVELDGDGVPTGMITVQSGFDTSMPVYIKGANAMRNGTGGNVIIEAGAPPLAAPEQLIQGGGPYDGTVGDIEMSANQTTIDSLGSIWTFRNDGVLQLPPGGDIVDSNGDTVLGGTGGSGDRLVNGDSSFSMSSDGTLTLTHPAEPALHPLATVLTVQKAAGNYHTISGAYGLSLQATPVPSGFGLNTNTNFVDIFHDGISVNVDNNTWTFGTDGTTTFPDASVQDTAYTLGSVFEYNFQWGLADQGYGNVVDPGYFTGLDRGSDTLNNVVNPSTLVISPQDANGKDISRLLDQMVDEGLEATITISSSGTEVATLVSTSVEEDFDYVTYKGFSVFLGRMWGSEPNKAKLVFCEEGDFESGPSMDYTVSKDRFKVFTTNPMGVVGMVVLYGSSPRIPLSKIDLWDFAKKVIDSVLYTGVSLNNATSMKSAFYANIDSIISTSLPSGSLYDNLEFFNNYFEIDANNSTVTTVAGAGALIYVSFDKEKYFTGNGIYNPGADYQVGDTFLVPGTLFGGTSPANDCLITVVTVDHLGGIRRVTATGTPDPNTVTWPIDHITDGGDDQEDDGNYIYTNVSGYTYNEQNDTVGLGAIPYAGGVVSDGTNYFGAGSNYVVTYKSSVFGIWADGASIGSIGTNGNSGFDGRGFAELAQISNVRAYLIYTQPLKGVGYWSPSSTYTIAFDTHGIHGTQILTDGQSRFEFHNNRLRSDQELVLQTFSGGNIAFETYDGYGGYGVELNLEHDYGFSVTTYGSSLPYSWQWYFDNTGKLFLPKAPVTSSIDALDQMKLSVSYEEDNAITVDIFQPGVSYTGLATDGTLVISYSRTGGYYINYIMTSSETWAIGDQVVISGSLLGGSDVINDGTFTITEAYNGYPYAWDATGQNLFQPKEFVLGYDGSLTLPSDNKITTSADNSVIVETSGTVTTTYSGSYWGWGTGASVGINVEYFVGIENVQPGWTINVQPDNLTYTITSVQTYPGGCFFYGGSTEPTQTGTYTLTGPATIASTWAFGTNGTLTLPLDGDIVDSTGTSVLGGGTTLPSQTDNNGKYLTTDGSALSWGTVAGGIPLTGATFNLDPNAGLTINTTDGAIELMRNGVTGVQIESDGVRLYASNLPVIWDGSVLKLPYGADVQRDISGNGPYVSVLNASNGTVVSRSTALISTASIAANVTDTVLIPAFKGYVLYKITTSAAAWVRLYSDVASRTADLATERPQTSDPSTDGVIAETVTTGADVVLITPGVYGFNNEYPLTSNIAAAITNLSGTTRSITVTLDILQTEA